MPKVMVCGRGGSGKSTLVTLLAGALSREGTVVVVDADESNLGLASMLGVEPPEQTVMGYLGGKPVVGKKLLESIRSEGGERIQLFEEEIDIDELPPELLSRSGPVSLVRIGKIEHSMEGCACPMGATARAFLNHLSTDEKSWVMVDTEAGIEHFGRGVLEGADMVLMIVDPSHEAVLLAEKAERLGIEADKEFLVVLNKVDGQSRSILEEKLSRKGIRALGAIQYSGDVTRANLVGDALLNKSPEADLGPILAALKGKVAPA